MPNARLPRIPEPSLVSRSSVSSTSLPLLPSPTVLIRRVESLRSSSTISVVELRCFSPFYRRFGHRWWYPSWWRGSRQLGHRLPHYVSDISVYLTLLCHGLPRDLASFVPVPWLPASTLRHFLWLRYFYLHNAFMVRAFLGLDVGHFCLLTLLCHGLPRDPALVVYDFYDYDYDSTISTCVTLLRDFKIF